MLLNFKNYPPKKSQIKYNFAPYSRSSEDIWFFVWGRDQTLFLIYENHPHHLRFDSCKISLQHKLQKTRNIACVTWITFLVLERSFLFIYLLFCNFWSFTKLFHHMEEYCKHLFFLFHGGKKESYRQDTRVNKLIFIFEWNNILYPYSPPVFLASPTYQWLSEDLVLTVAFTTLNLWNALSWHFNALLLISLLLRPASASGRYW